MVVSTDSVVEANITAGSISLAGRINGNLTAPGVVSLPLQSRVEGDPCGQRHRSGSVKGDLVAEDRVELGQEAWVDGSGSPHPRCDASFSSKPTFVGELTSEAVRPAAA